MSTRSSQTDQYWQRMQARELLLEGGITQPVQVEQLHAHASSTRQREKDEYLMGLYEKHGAIPGPYRPSSGPVRVYKPPAQGSKYADIHPDGPVLQPQFDSYGGGDSHQDRVRSHDNTRFLSDGRSTSDNRVVDSTSTGEHVPMRQSVYEAQHTRGLMGKAAKREVQALNDLKGTHSMPGRAVAVDWQGPSSYTTDTGANSRIPRRHTTQRDHSLSMADGTGALFQSYQPPTNTVARVTRRTYANTRSEVTGTVSGRVETPQIEQFATAVSRPRVFDMSSRRIVAPSDTSTYTMDPTVASDRGSNFQTTQRPILNSGPQKPVPGVAGNRTEYQRTANMSTTVDREMQQDGYTREYEGSVHLGQYQRQFTGGRMFNKLPPSRPHEHILVERDFIAPVARHADRRILT